MQVVPTRSSVPDFTPVFEPQVAPALTGELLELSRPCLRHVELEVDITRVDPELDLDPWFVAHDAELPEAADAVYLPAVSSLPSRLAQLAPIAVGVAVAATSLALVVFV